MSQSQHQTAEAPPLGSRENHWGDLTDDQTDGPESDHLDDCSYSELVEITCQQCDVENPTGTADELKALIRAAREDQEESDKPDKCYSTEYIARWKAHKILRQTSPKHSPIAKYQPPDRGLGEWGAAFAYVFDGKTIDHDPTAMHTEKVEVELTEPVVTVPRESKGSHFGTREYGQFRHRSRFDPEHGYVTGPDLGDRPAEEFMATVDIVLANAKAELSFCDEKIENWRRDARQMKRIPEMSDEDVLTTILEEMFDDSEDY